MISQERPEPAPEKIRRFGSHCLRQVAPEADPAAESTRRLLDQMWAVLAADGGVGLAAPQIGVLKRVVVIRDPKRPRDRQRIDLVNPVVEETFGELKPYEEGCLSFPGLFTTVLRPSGVELRYFDIAGQEQRIRDESLLARIILHEVDHLNGVLFIDHLSGWQRLLLGPRLSMILLLKLLGK